MNLIPKSIVKEAENDWRLQPRQPRSSHRFDNLTTGIYNRPIIYLEMTCPFRLSIRPQCSWSFRAAESRSRGGRLSSRRGHVR